MKKFSVQLFFRVFLVFINAVVLASIFGTDTLIFNQIFLGVLLLLQLFLLIKYVNHTNKSLSEFLLAIQYGDKSRTFYNSEMGKTFRQLDEVYNAVIGNLKEADIRNTIQHQQLNLIVENVNVGIFSFNGDEITLLNKAALRLLGISPLKSLRLLEIKRPVFVQEILAMKEGSRTLIEVAIEKQFRQFSIQSNSLVLDNGFFKVITFQDIREEIEQKEVEAWFKLIKVLTHEIMNSITPISSLCETLLMMLDQEAADKESGIQLNKETLADFRFSLETILKRSEGISCFVSDYRKLSRIPQPVPEYFEIDRLFKTASQLMKGECEKEKIEISFSVAEESMALNADFHLVEQVLLNLITNSIHALEGRDEKKISVSAYIHNRAKIIEVCDTGKGIDKEKLDKIFIPFYSTKAFGTGIGLSIAKQIMVSHKGTLTVKSEINKETSFYLNFQ